jgi:hypothetical protein
MATVITDRELRELREITEQLKAICAEVRALSREVNALRALLPLEENRA